MTTLKKNGLAVALVAAMGFAGSASAFTITTTPSGPSGSPATENVALFDVTTSSDTYTVNEDVTLKISASDLIVGRDAAFAVRIDLSNGARFATAPTITLGTSAPSPDWSTSVIGGGAGSSFIIIRVNPVTNPLPAGSVVTPGPVLTLVGGSYSLDHLTALTEDGATVTLTAQFQDPLSAQVILSPKSFTLLKSGDPTEFTCDPTAGDFASRVDVGTGDPAGTYESKTTFSYYGAINGGGYYYFDAGDLDINVASGFPAFVYQTTDDFTTVLTGSFSSFVDGAVTLHLCNNDIAGDVSADGTTVTFEYTGDDLCAPTTSTSGSVEFGTDGSVIDPTTITASTTITRNDVSTTSAGCNLLPIQYNGSVVKVATFNPGGNTTQQSFLRVTNPSNLSGNVTITGIDDAGHAGASAVVVPLAAGESIQLNSDVLENGGDGVTGALGNGTGKWRLVVTGEFDKMRVASLNRNTVTGTVTNLTDYDTNAEQSKLLDTSGLPPYIGALLPGLGSDY